MIKMSELLDKEFWRQVRKVRPREEEPPKDKKKQKPTKPSTDKK